MITSVGRGAPPLCPFPLHSRTRTTTAQFIDQKCTNAQWKLWNVQHYQILVSYSFLFCSYYYLITRKNAAAPHLFAVAGKLLALTNSAYKVDTAHLFFFWLSFRPVPISGREGRRPKNLASRGVHVHNRCVPVSLHARTVDFVKVVRAVQPFVRGCSREHREPNRISVLQGTPPWWAALNPQRPCSLASRCARAWRRSQYGSALRCNTPHAAHPRLPFPLASRCATPFALRRGMCAWWSDAAHSHTSCSLGSVF